MKRSDLKALYIKRIQELTRRYKMSKYEALQRAYRPLIKEVTPLHNNWMDAAVHVGMVCRELMACEGYEKKKKRRKTNSRKSG